MKTLFDDDRLSLDAALGMTAASLDGFGADHAHWRVAFSGGKDSSATVDQPQPTATARGTQNQLVTANLVHLNHGDKTASGADDPMHTVTGRDRLGLVTIQVSGETYVIVDIGMRMLTPRELARGQGFPDDYKLPGEQMPGTKTAATAMIGNSVSPPLACAMAAANYAPAEALA